MAYHRCDPPSAGVTTTVPQPPSPWPTSITALQAVTSDTWTVVTGTCGPAITEVYPPRLEIHGGTAA